jgi:hypothetical protein
MNFPLNIAAVSGIMFVWISSCAAQSIVVTLYYVDIKEYSVDEKFYACGSADAAGQFLSGDTAVDWKNQFADGAEVFSLDSNNADACVPPPAWYVDSGEWHSE